MAASGTCTDKDEAATGDESGRSQQSPEIGDGGGGQTHAQSRGSFAQVARRRHKQGREEKGPHGQDKSQSRVCHRSRASAWAQPWGVTPSESRAPARLLALARRNAIRRARRAGRRGAGPSEIAQHRISMCPSCLPVPARASSRLAHSPPSRAINAGPTLGQRAPHATPVGTSRDRRYGRESYPNLLLKYSTLEGGRERLRSTVDFFQIARAHRQYVTCSQHKFFTPTGAGEGPQDYTCFTYVRRRAQQRSKQ